MDQRKPVAPKRASSTAARALLSSLASASHPFSLKQPPKPSMVCEAREVFTLMFSGARDMVPEPETTVTLAWHCLPVHLPHALLTKQNGMCDAVVSKVHAAHPGVILHSLQHAAASLSPSTRRMSLPQQSLPGMGVQMSVLGGAYNRLLVGRRCQGSPCVEHLHVTLAADTLVRATKKAIVAAFVCSIDVIAY